MSEQKPSRLPIWFVLSLVVNALLIGLMIGGGLGKRHSGGHDRPAAGGEMHIARSLERVVSDEERAVLRTALREAFNETREQRRALRQARRELRDLLSQETYDREAVQAAFAKLRTAEGDVKVAMHDELAIQFEKLTTEQRRAVLRNIERGPRGREGRRGPPPPRD